MADPIFDKEGNLTNLDELDRDEVAKAYSEKNREVFARATEEKKKREEVEAALAKTKSDLEAASKAPAPAAPEVPQVSQKPQQPDIGELRLMIGLSDEAIEQANIIAKGLGVSLKEAANHPLFKAYQETEKAKRDAEDSKLSASKGSDQYIPPEGIKPGQTKEEHEAAFRKAAGLPPVAKI